MECFVMAGDVQIQTVSIWEINATCKSKDKNVDLKEIKWRKESFMVRIFINFCFDFLTIIEFKNVLQSEC